MNTTQEIRARHALEVDAFDGDFVSFKLKNRRTTSTVPSAYDDINRPRNSRTWKNFRRTKWRA
ncbi:MAG: hypothetical protein NTX72_04915 [Candidatus Uhrbacteria bacterium]|nr:hypothetical protein [Candidatus Uhrbacteria bacterium]